MKLSFIAFDPLLTFPHFLFSNEKLYFRPHIAESDNITKNAQYSGLPYLTSPVILGYTEI
jgi:hypothetical protein